VIEEWFYLIAPIFLLAVIRLFKNRKKIIVLSIILFILFIVVIRAIYVLKTGVPFQGVRGNVPFRFDTLFVGVLLAYLHHSKWKIYNSLYKPFALFLGIIIFFGYLYLVWMIQAGQNATFETYGIKIFGFLILSFSIALIIPRVTLLKDEWKANAIVRIFSRFLTWTSLLTYSVYLIHMFIYSWDFLDRMAPSRWANFTINIFCVYIFSWMIYTFFEKPILQFRDRITRTKVN
jgi:peptidoglycan/LPS O-acetylase OafA/YrhL